MSTQLPLIVGTSGPVECVVTDRRPFVNPRQAKNFALAGNAHFTARSKITGDRFTYRVNSPQHSTAVEQMARNQRPIWFVAVMVGPDNERSYKYIGLIRDTLEFHWGDKSRIPRGDIRVRGFQWLWNMVIRPEDQILFDSRIEVWHEGRCGRCGRRLTVPESIASGYGPECVGRVQR